MMDSPPTQLNLGCIIRCSLESQGLPTAAIEPVPGEDVSSVEGRTMEERVRWWKMGLKAISEGNLAVLLLSGGQGTRLGSSDPKGCFSNHKALYWPSSGKSLFQLQAERILCVQKLAAHSMKEAPVASVPIHWYIMTSPFTDEATRNYFESHKYFGFEAEHVVFFQQGTMPCVSKDGRFIMETPFSVAKAPDGNGGVYSALKTFSWIAMELTMRWHIPRKRLESLLGEAKETGRLRYCWSNVCLHMFTLDFLNQVANGLEKDSIFQLAEKIIPSIHGHTVGLKLEQFIFDAFPYAPSTALFEVLRDEEFALVKNANGLSFDTPDSARLLVLRLHTRWVVAAGGLVTHSVPLYATGVEVSPLCSYAGENLEALCRGRTFHTPCEISF
ncbi:hypothetical protein MLD38_021021 [Melastoma candidum]|uniref:Uncharacterized protein n=1 Tax=Melastoma candidum TaxID=119954 RepID=A0ACB9QEP1_9MYRT|nr:hypothetical protein MLD38_021021 [Melastoma candidum]